MTNLSCNFWAKLQQGRVEKISGGGIHTKIYYFAQLPLTGSIDEFILSLLILPMCNGP